MSALKHWDGVHARHRLLMEFMEWLESGKAMPGGSKVRFDLDTQMPGYHATESLGDLHPERLADRFLEVDRSALERERRELIEKARKA